MDQTKKVIPILHQKWKYLAMWNKGTSLVKNSSQTVEIKNKTNEEKPYLEQNISNHKLDGWDKKANTNTSPEMKISCNVKQGTSLVKNTSQTVEIKDKTMKKGISRAKYI